MVDRQGYKNKSLNDGWNLAIFSTDLTLEESMFQRVCATTESLHPNVSIYSMDKM